MNSYTDRTQETRSRDIVNGAAGQVSGNTPAVWLTDNRARTAIQKKQVEAMAGKRPVQMKSAVNINDNAALEREADVMGAKAMQLHGWPVPVRNSFSAALSTTVQRRLTDDGYTLPPDERTLNGFLGVHEFDLPFECSAANLAALTAEHAALLNLIAPDATAQFETPGATAYDDLLTHAGSFQLAAGTVSWNEAVAVGADSYEANPAPNLQAIANAAWNGMNAMPNSFEQAVAAEVAHRVQARVQAINNAYQAYINDNRLNQGTIHRIRQIIPNADLAAVTARLAVVYGRQCNITRNNWLTHLQIAGQAINGTAALHYTTFNNAVSTPPALRVDQHTAAQLRNILFATVNPDLRIHATLVVNGVSYHRYWGGVNSPNVAQLGAHDRNTLLQEYTRMEADMTLQVTNAKNQHGRVAANHNGAQTGVGP